MWQRVSEPENAADPARMAVKSAESEDFPGGWKAMRMSSSSPGPQLAV